MARRACAAAPSHETGTRGPVEGLGRTLAVVVPVAAVELVVGHRSPMATAAAILVSTVVWLGFLNLGLAAGRTTLSSLGHRVAVLRGVLLGLVAMTALGAWVPALTPGLGALLVEAAAIAVAAAAWETVVESSLRSPKRLLLVGPATGCDSVIREFARGEANGFELVGIVEDADGANESELVLGSVDELSRIIEKSRPDLVALVPGGNRPKIFGQLLDAATWDFRVLEMAQFYEHAFGRVPVRDLTNAWFMSVIHFYARPSSRFVKRASDVAAALLLLVFSLPFLPVLILLVRTTPGPVFYRQVRIGEHGKLFTMLKFRTMRVDAERPGEAVWASQKDPRATSTGQVMRRLRLDELPQIFNILRGDMSFVGPRPERPEFLDELVGVVPFWTHRHLVKPGITGWAQVNRGYTTDAEGTLEKLSYDLWYIRHRSLMVDFVICMRTLAAVMRGTHKTARRVEQPHPRVMQTRPLAVHPVEAQLEVEHI